MTMGKTVRGTAARRWRSGQRRGWGVTTCTGSCRRKGGGGVKREHNLAERRESGEPVQVEGGWGGESWKERRRVDSRAARGKRELLQRGGRGWPWPFRRVREKGVTAIRGRRLVADAVQGRDGAIGEGLAPADCNVTPPPPPPIPAHTSHKPVTYCGNAVINHPYQLPPPPHPTPPQKKEKEGRVLLRAAAPFPVSPDTISCQL